LESRRYRLATALSVGTDVILLGAGWTRAPRVAAQSLVSVKSRSFRSRANWFLCWIFGMIHQNCRWELPLRHQDACAIGTMLSAGIGGRMPGAFLACLPWLLPDNPQKVFIEVPSAFGAGSKIGCFGPASFCVFGEKRRPGKGRFLAAQATLQDEKTGVK
jgi:hypothetical protein